MVSHFMNNQNNFAVRTATRADAKAIYNFIVGLARYENMMDEVEVTEQSVLDTIFDRGQAEVIIGEEDGAPVGFALFYHNYSTFKGRRGIFLEDLFVDPSMRGKGYGKQIFLEVAKIAHERGCCRMEWFCLNWNTPSIEFYKANGAQAMDVWTTYRLDADTLRSMAEA